MSSTCLLLVLFFVWMSIKVQQTVADNIRTWYLVLNLRSFNSITYYLIIHIPFRALSVIPPSSFIRHVTIPVRG